MTYTFSKAAKLALYMSVASVPFAVAEAAIAQSSEAKAFSIPAGQDLATALNAYAAQSGAEILFTPDIVRGRRASGLFGTRKPAVALRLILEGTGLTFRMTSGNAYLIEVSNKALGTGQGGPPTAGEDNAGSAAAHDESAEIVVTGSRLGGPGLASPNPLQVFDAATIQQSGETNLTEILTESPALTNSISSERAAGTNVATNSQLVGLNLLNLRNLGTARTLVLVNGKRHVNAYPGENSVDVNTIPLSLVEAVDILTGGASAIYGADAVSGVVNFRLKRDFDGVRARGQVGISQHGDAGTRFGSVTAGRNFADGRANITIAYEYSESDSLSRRDRRFTGDPARRYELIRDLGDRPDDPNRPDRILVSNTSWRDTSPSGAFDLDLDGAPDFDGYGNPYDRGILQGNGRALNSRSNTPTAGYDGDFLPELRRHNVNILARYEVSPALRLTVEGKYVSTKATSREQPTFDFATYLTDENPFLRQRFGARAAGGAIFGRDHFDLGIQTPTSDRDTIRAVFGADGRLTQSKGSGNLRYDISYVYGRSRSRTVDLNTRVLDRYLAGLDAVVDPATGLITCRINLPGQTIIDPFNYAGIATINGRPVTGAPLTFNPGKCVPLNIVGEGVASQAALDFVMIDDLTLARSTQHVATATLAGDFGFLFDLPGGPIEFVIGGEFRKEASRITPSAFAQIGAFDGGVRSAISRGKYDVKEAFAEIRVPLLRDRPFVQELSIGGALRFSDYSTIGSTTTWKVDGFYAPIRDVAFRATYSQVVRSPNISELFKTDQGTFQFISDPCDLTNVAEGTQYRAANCRTLLQAASLTPVQIAAFSPSLVPSQNTAHSGIVGGNPDLQEETAKTWTAGIVLKPTFLPGLSLSADWYDIRIKDAISTPEADDVLANCVDAPTVDNVFCSLISRETGTGFVNSFEVRAQNVAGFTTSGLDLELNYRFNISPQSGDFNLRLVGGYLNDLTFIPSVGSDPDQDRGEQYSPKYLGSLDLTWSYDDLTLNYGLSWQDKTRRYTTEQVQANPDISDPRFFYYKERWKHDVQASYRINDRFTLYGGVNNFTDQKPSIATDAGYPVSAVGRYFFMGARAGF